MSIAAAAQLYSEPGLNGTSLLAGLGAGQRYAIITQSDLASADLLNSVDSGSLDTSNADLNLVLFGNADYSGPFAQMSMPHGDDGTFWASSSTQSALLIASNQSGTQEERLSFTSVFQSQWDSFLDHTLQGTQVSRVGEPLLTWRMFPNGDQPGDQYLNANQTYLHIQQELLITLPWYWPNYHAVMAYWVELSAQDGQLTAWVAAWYLDVDSGEKHSKIQNQLAPKVQDGMSSLQTQLSQQLAIAALLNPTDVYLLPGTQLSPIELGPAFIGNTDDDVTIVIVH